MTNKSQIIVLPNPVLRAKSQRVSKIDKKIVQLVDAMKATTLEWEKNRPHEVGVAMAANQIGRPERVIIIRQESTEPEGQVEFEVLINPKIIRQDGEVTPGFEGCLSVPDLYGQVPRYSKIKIAAQTLDGQAVRLKAKGFLARVLQHEIDHLEGKLFIDHIKDQKFYKLNQAGKYQALDDNELKKYSFLR